jgi:hypothetical protein
MTSLGSEPLANVVFDWSPIGSDRISGMNRTHAIVVDQALDSSRELAHAGWKKSTDSEVSSWQRCSIREVVCKSVLPMQLLVEW